MRFKRHKVVAAIVLLFAIVGVVVYRLQSNRQGASLTVRWEGWRYGRLVLKERDIYIADASMVAQRFRYVQLGPVRILRGPVEP